MYKSEYLQQPAVAGFVDWLSKDCGTRTFTLDILRSRFVDTAVRRDVTGMEGLLDQYNWKSSWTHPITGEAVNSADWRTTQLSTNQLGKGLQKAMDQNDEALSLKWCLCILKWGGVSGAIPFLGSLAGEQKLVKYLSSIQPLLSLDTESDDAAINTSNILRFDAGLTKIHAFIDTTGSPIYDSRVGAAISMFAAIYCKEAKISPATALLRFPAGNARGAQYRNPKNMGYKPAPKFYTPAVTRDYWARSQLRLGWIIQAAINKNKKLFEKFETQAEKIQAFQGAFFMAGYDLRCFEYRNDPPNKDNSAKTPPIEPFGNVVPTNFSMPKISQLLVRYQGAHGHEPQQFTRNNFIDWQTRFGGVAKRNTAVANCYPLQDSEFAIYDRSAEEIDLFCKGGYNSLLKLVGRITPSPEEREHVCLINVFLTGKLYEGNHTATERQQRLLERGFAGPGSAANNLLSVGRSVGKHFDLLNPDNTPTKHFSDYFSGDEWEDLFPDPETDL